MISLEKLNPLLDLSFIDVMNLYRGKNI